MFFVLTLFNFSLIQFLIPTNHAYTHIKIIILSFLFCLRSFALYIYQFVYWLDFAFLKRGCFFLFTLHCCLFDNTYEPLVPNWRQKQTHSREPHRIADNGLYVATEKNPEMLKINHHLHQPTLELVSMSLLQYLGLFIKFSHCYKRRILIKQV